MNHLLLSTTLLVGFYLPKTCLGESWVPLSVPGFEGISSYYVDTDSLVRKGNIVRVWERLVFAYPHHLPPIGRVESSKYLMAYDCAHKSAAVLESTFYKDADSLNELERRVRAKPKYLVIAPGSSPEHKLEEVCRLAKRR
jgi:hypothetical protein